VKTLTAVPLAYETGLFCLETLPCDEALVCSDYGLPDAWLDATPFLPPPAPPSVGLYPGATVFPGTPTLPGVTTTHSVTYARLGAVALGPHVGLFPPAFPGAVTFPGLSSAPQSVGLFPSATTFPGTSTVPGGSGLLTATPIDMEA